MGQNNLVNNIQSELNGNKKVVYWFHAASLGEYNVIRPVIKKMRNDSSCTVVTFFSPTGYDFLTKENCRTKEADYIFYLPLDTSDNAAWFIEAIKPQKAIFAVSEHWPNYHKALKSKNIPTYIVSMSVSHKSYLMKWYGQPIRKALASVHTFMVQDEISKTNLAKIGFDNVVITGDPLFDNAISISKEDYHDDIIEKFCASGKEVFIAGSVSDRKDLSLVSHLANIHPDVKFVVVPHQICEEGLNEIKSYMMWKTKLYSECKADTDFSDTHVLVIDFLGVLSRIYRYANWAYVGGGFTPYLHSIIEPVVYGIPVAFGPRIERKQTAKQIIRLGVGHIVSSKAEIKSWFKSVRDNDRLSAIQKLASEYVENNSNVTDKVIQALQQ